MEVTYDEDRAADYEEQARMHTYPQFSPNINQIPAFIEKN